MSNDDRILFYNQQDNNILMGANINKFSKPCQNVHQWKTLLYCCSDPFSPNELSIKQQITTCQHHPPGRGNVILLDVSNWKKTCLYPFLVSVSLLISVHAQWHCQSFCTLFVSDWWCNCWWGRGHAGAKKTNWSPQFPNFYLVLWRRKKMPVFLCLTHYKLVSFRPWSKLNTSLKISVFALQYHHGNAHLPHSVFNPKDLKEEVNMPLSQLFWNWHLI